MFELHKDSKAKNECLKCKSVHFSNIFAKNSPLLITKLTYVYVLTERPEIFNLKVMHLSFVSIHYLFLSSKRSGTIIIQADN